MTIPATMRAIVLQDPAEPRSLVLADVPTPSLQPGEALIKVAYAGVNRADLLQAQGHYPPPAGASEIIGLECAGVVVDPGDTDLTVGEEVGCLLAGGGYAEYVAVPEGQCLRIPAGGDLKTTASLVEVACTVYSNLSMVAGLQAGQTVLLHGGAGGIGTFAIQYAKALGCQVAVTAGSAEKLERCRQLGADILINYREQDFVEQLAGQVDVILDIMGAKYLPGNVRCLKPEGKLVIIGLQGGRKGELNILELLNKRASVHATTLRLAPQPVKETVVAGTQARVWPLVEHGQIRPEIHQVLPLAQAAAAHELLASGQVVGKVLLQVAAAE